MGGSSCVNLEVVGDLQRGEEERSRRLGHHLVGILSSLPSNFPVKVATHTRYRTPQPIPLANYERIPWFSLLVQVAWGVFQFGVLKQPQKFGSEGYRLLGGSSRGLVAVVNHLGDRTSKSPKQDYAPSKWPILWLINGGDPNYLTNWDDPPSIQPFSGCSGRFFYNHFQERYPGKLTFCTRKRRWMENGFPFQLGDFYVTC